MTACTGSRIARYFSAVAVISFYCSICVAQSSPGPVLPGTKPWTMPADPAAEMVAERTEYFVSLNYVVLWLPSTLAPLCARHSSQFPRTLQLSGASLTCPSSGFSKNKDRLPRVYHADPGPRAVRFPRLGARYPDLASPLVAEDRSFVDAVLDDGSVPITGHDGLVAVRMVNAAPELTESHMPVKF